MARFRAVATDWGGDSGPDGGKFMTKGAPYGVCPACKISRPVTKGAWFRKSKPKCARCGAYLTPSRRAQKRNTRLNVSAKATKERRCLRCRAKLRSSNKEKLCSPCFAIFARRESWTRGSARGKTNALSRFLSSDSTDPILP